MMTKIDEYLTRDTWSLQHTIVPPKKQDDFWKLPSDEAGRVELAGRVRAFCKAIGMKEENINEHL